MQEIQEIKSNKNLRFLSLNEAKNKIQENATPDKEKQKFIDSVLSQIDQLQARTLLLASDYEPIITTLRSKTNNNILLFETLKQKTSQITKLLTIYETLADFIATKNILKDISTFSFHEFDCLSSLKEIQEQENLDLQKLENTVKFLLFLINLNDVF